jgi:hypothetical protein
VGELYAAPALEYGALGSVERVPDATGELDDQRPFGQAFFLRVAEITGSLEKREQAQARSVLG